MSSNTAAGAISRFLTASPETASSGELMERLASLLPRYGDAGAPLAEAVDISAMSKAEFLTALSGGQSSGLLEVFEDEGGTRIKLGPVGKSLF